MTSRRVVASEKTLLEQQGGPPPGLITSDTSPAVPASVIYKLLFFTLAMVGLPIGSYFATIDIVFGGNATYAGGFAAVMANVVLIAYIIVAMMEDQSEKIEKTKKAQ